MTEWEIKPIDTLCESIVDCVNRTAPKVNYETPYKMIRTTNVRHGRINLDDVFYVDEPTYKKWTRRSVPRVNDVILTREAPLGEVGILKTKEQVFLGQRTVMYRANTQICNPLFLFYALQSPQCQKHIKSFASGSTVEHMRVPDSKKIEVPTPRLAIQNKVASILSAYDDLIENNLKRIKLLEEIAQRTYEEWFVQFRVNGKQLEVEKGTGLPRGWEKCKLKDLLILNYGKALKAEDRVDGKFPVYGSSGIVGSHNHALVQGPGVILGRKGNVGSVYWTAKDFYAIDTVYYVASNISLYFLFEHLKSKTFVNNDAAVPGLNRNAAYLMDAFLPPSELLDSYEKLARPIFSKIEILHNQNFLLKESRDILLPRLMSGKIEVK